MAKPIKRGPYQWQAQVRRKGYPTQTCTFETKREAEAWIASTETDMRKGVFVDRSEAERTTLGELLERYLNEVTPKKRGYRAETNRIKQLLRHPLSQYFVSRILSPRRSD